MQYLDLNKFINIYEKIELKEVKIINNKIKIKGIKKKISISEFKRLVKGLKLNQWDKSKLKQKKAKKTKSQKHGSIPDNIRMIVKERDGHKCIFCNENYNLEIAHIKSRGAGGSGKNAHNLVTLCSKHHKILDQALGKRELEIRIKIKSKIKEHLK